jgi:hypothetical protein
MRVATSIKFKSGFRKYTDSSSPTAPVCRIGPKMISTLQRCT